MKEPVPTKSTLAALSSVNASEMHALIHAHGRIHHPRAINTQAQVKHEEYYSFVRNMRENAAKQRDVSKTAIAETI